MLTPDNIVKSITLLLGPNGTGKSMSIRNLFEEFRGNGYKAFIYSNKGEDIVTHHSEWDPRKLVCAFHSEGERICDSINDWADRVYLKELLTNTDDIVFLFDEFDSGLSYDRLQNQIRDFNNIIQLEKEKHPLRIVKYIYTCNSYEMLECFDNISDELLDIIWVPTKEHIPKMSYEEFKNRYIQYYEYMTPKDEQI